MATPTLLQADLDATGKKALLVRSTYFDATYDQHYIVGLSSPYNGKSGWVKTTNGSSSSTQAGEALTALALL